MLASACALGCEDAPSNEPVPPQRDASSDEPAVDAGAQDRMDGSSATLDARVAPAKYVPLIDMEDWRRYDAAVDPLKSHQPAEIRCAETATYVEYRLFEVDTTRCNYVLSYTPALRAVPAGTELRVHILHYDLLAPEPANAHLALIFNDSVQWEKTIPIPSPGNGVEASFVTTEALSFQDPIRLHLHNHGGNTYLFMALEVPDAP